MARVRSRLMQRVRILGRWYAIRRPFGIIVKGTEYDGLADLANHTIYIDAGLSRQDARERLRHEIDHVIKESLFVNPNTESGHAALSVVSDAVFADNPALVRLYEKERR